MLVCKQNIFKTGLKSNYWSIFLVIVLLNFLATGCEDDKSAQCQQIFRIAQDVKASNHHLGKVNLDSVNEPSSEIMKNWLQSANEFNQAADHLALLEINHSELIKYQNQLISLYRIYSQATYDAVRARENQDLSALQSARQNAIKAGKIQQQLIQKINTYCLSNQ